MQKEDPPQLIIRVEEPEQKAKINTQYPPVTYSYFTTCG